MSLRVLYLSQTGMTEPLGQSQVLGYLERLADRGVSYELLSMEPAGTPPAAVASVRERLAQHRISWTPLERRATQHLGRKVVESGWLGARALERAVRARPHVVHARAHFPAAMAEVVATMVPGSRFLFDCRGLLGDQYVDVGHWTEQQLEYRALKAWERHAFGRADGLVVLTHALERWLVAERQVPSRTPRRVIPCCVDARRFGPDERARAELRAELGVGERPLVAYAGGLGAWYLEDEMAAFVTALRRHVPEVGFLVMTRAPSERLRALLERRGFPMRDVFVRAVPPERMPAMVASVDVGLALIKPSFAVIGTSPTKLAEYLASGALAVANAGVGDIAELAGEPACVVAPDLREASLAAAAADVAERLRRPRRERARAARALALRHFGLDEIGVPAYEGLYDEMTRGGS